MVVAAIGVAAMSADARSQLRKYRNVLIDELGDAVTALARAARALDPRYVQLASDIACVVFTIEREIESEGRREKSLDSMSATGQTGPAEMPEQGVRLHRNLR